MKKAEKIILIIAAVCMALGILIGGTVMLKHIHSLSDFTSTPDYRKQTREITDEVNALEISVPSDELYFLPSADGKLRVEYYETDRLHYEIGVTDGKLKMSYEYLRNGSFDISVNFGDLKEVAVRVYLPKKQYTALNAKSASGEITVASGISVTDCTLEAGSGEIEYGGNADTLTVKTSSGEVALNGNAKRVFVNTSSGEVCSDGMTPESLKIETGSGEISLENVIVTKEMKLKTASGEIELENCDAAELNIETASGEVEAMLLSPKRFKTKFASGSVRVPDSVEGAGMCTVTTASGDISIRVR